MEDEDDELTPEQLAQFLKEISEFSLFVENEVFKKIPNLFFDRSGYKKMIYDGEKWVEEITPGGLPEIIVKPEILSKEELKERIESGYYKKE